MSSTFDELFTSPLDIATLYFGYNANDKELSFTVRETGSPEHEKVQRKYSKALEKSRRNQKRNRAIMAKIVAESLLVDWKGVLDDSGNEVPCTLENKINALTKYKKLFIEIIDFASEPNNFQIDDDEIVDDELTPEEDTEKN